MAVNTPWCPRCGAWRGYVAALCKGCMKINESITPDMCDQRKTALIAAAQTPEQKAQYEALTEPQLYQLVLRDLVQERFIKISEMRTDREAFTQGLEEMVEQNTDLLKQVCYSWMRMRPESRRVRFSNMYALEMVSVARQALEMVGALSLELTKFTENKVQHEEYMKVVTAGMQAVEKFINPDPNEPEEPQDEETAEETGEDLPPGANS